MNLKQLLALWLKNEVAYLDPGKLPFEADDAPDPVFEYLPQGEDRLSCMVCVRFGPNQLPRYFEFKITEKIL